MKQVQAFQTEDGELHLTKSAAREHRANIDFDHWYEDSPLYWENRSIDSENIKVWLRMNKDKLIDFLGEPSPEVHEPEGERK